MWRSLVCVFFLAILFAGAQSKIDRRSVHREIMKKLDVKRQASDQQQASGEEDQCVEDKLENKLENTECMERIEELDSVLDDMDDESETDQQEVNDIFSVYCLPECGKLILEAEDECGVFDDQPALRDFAVGLCGTNSDGKKCYEYLSSAFDFIIDTEVECYVDSKLKDSCECRSELVQTANEQGCCINVYHDFFEAAVEAGSGGYSYKPNELYTEVCDIRLAGDCNNSPLSGARALEFTCWVTALALLFALIG